MPGKRGRLGGDAFHQIAIATNRVDVVIENFEIRTIESGGQPSFSDCHAYAVSATLPKGAGGGFNASGEVRLGMAGCAAVKLTKTLDFFQRDSEIAGDLRVVLHLPYACQV